MRQSVALVMGGVTRIYFLWMLRISRRHANKRVVDLFKTETV